jgi:hypothetical protein
MVGTVIQNVCLIGFLASFRKAISDERIELRIHLLYPCNMNFRKLARGQSAVMQAPQERRYRLLQKRGSVGLRVILFRGCTCIHICCLDVVGRRKSRCAGPRHDRSGTARCSDLRSTRSSLARRD